MEQDRLLTPDQFFFFDWNLVPEGFTIFPFHIFLFSQNSHDYYLYLAANSPLDDIRAKELESYLSKGAKVAILKSQKRTLEKHLGLSIAEESTSLHHLEERRLLLLKQDLLEAESGTKQKTDLDLIRQCFAQDDFFPLIQRMRKEVMAFPVTISTSVTQASLLTEKLEEKDNTTNRIASLCYFYAKIQFKSSEHDLAEIVLASYLHKIGLTQLDSEWACHRPSEQDQQRSYMKQTLLTSYLIEKIGFPLSNSSLTIILDHLERPDGSGGPEGKAQNQLTALSRLLSAISYLVHFSQGHYSDSEMKLIEVVKCFSSELELSNLERNFDSEIRDGLRLFLDYTNKEAFAA